MKYVLGIDLGTSGTKTVLFDQNGTKVSDSTVLYDIIQLKNGWAEQDPNDWWKAVISTVQAVLKDSKISADDISGIGISGQMHGLVMVDKKGEVLRNAILWCDGRTTNECEEITKKVGAEKLIEITANPALTGFTAGKILWVKKHEPEIYEKCYKILLPKDFLRYKLTGLFGSEVSDASGTNLFDIKNRTWSNEILEILDIDKDFFPDCKESVEIAGNVSNESAKITGLSENTVVCYGAGDNAAAAIGMGVVSTDKAFTSIGTSGVIFSHSDKPKIDQKGRVHTFCSAIPNGYTIMSCTLAAGMSLKWFRDNFCENDNYKILDQKANNIPIGSDKLLFLPYLMGERSPILDEKSRGAFIGLSAIHNKYHMTRSVMEGIVFSQKHCLDVINELGVYPKTMYACGGGAKSDFWTQMMSDVYNTEIVINQNDEGPALGVAVLAAVASGLYDNIQIACEKIIEHKKKYAPINDNTIEYNKYYTIYKDLYNVLEPSFNKLYKI